MRTPNNWGFADREINFWKQIEEKYGSRAGLEDFVFESSRTPSIVHCKLHGDTQVDARKLLCSRRKHVCTKCSRKMMRHKDDVVERAEEFKRKIINIYGSYEGFEKFTYINNFKPSVVHCKSHGDYLRTPSSLLRGFSCKVCAKDAAIKNRADVVKGRLAALYGDSLDFSAIPDKSLAEDKGRVTVHCFEHGDFMKTVGNLLLGLGCNQCMGKVVNEYTTSSFKKKIATIRGTDEGLEPTTWNGHGTGTLIECSVHGVVPIFPTTLLAGGWCEQCSILGRVKWDTASVIEESKRLFPEKLDYTDTVYEHYLKPMIFRCFAHGKFEAILDRHFRSAYGCPGCTERGGYSDMRPGYFYILRSDDLTKIGITNKGPEHRAKNINKSGKDFKIVEYFHFEDGSIPRKLEYAILQKYRSTHEQPKEIFDGYTESFYDVDMDTLLSDVSRKIIELDGQKLSTAG